MSVWIYQNAELSEAAQAFVDGAATLDALSGMTETAQREVIGAATIDAVSGVSATGTGGSATSPTGSVGLRLGLGLSL